MHRIRLLAAFALCVATASGSARADDDDDRKTEWYGAPIIATDASALLLGTVGVSAGGGSGLALGFTSFALYAFGGPVIHNVHQQGEKAALDVMMRIGLPLVGTLIGAGIGAAIAGPQPSCDSRSSFCLNLPPVQELEGALVGAGVGIFSASVFDIAVLACGPVRHDRADHDAHADLLRLRPSVTYTRDLRGDSPRPLLGIAGTF
jgi:hypothetical protein